jgi:predicted CXXCH cytochrome family protein
MGRVTFRLRQIELTADGREIIRDKDIVQDDVTLGRAAANDIHLPDLAVEPGHATIAWQGDNRVAVTALGTLGFGLDGRVTRAATVDCRAGAELRFGSFRITVSQDSDGAVLLTIRPVEEKGILAADFDEKRGFSLASLLPGKRKVAWLTALLILALFLALPIASHRMRATEAKTPVIGDASWRPGKLSLAHHGLEDRCEACHVKAFVSVRNEACMGCHKDAHDHAPPARLAGARADPPLGQSFLQFVAHSFGKPGPGACVDCHSEHEGAGRMAAPQQQFCADCHASLGERLRETKLGDAGDFGTLHPQFTPQIVTDPATRQLSRVSLDAHPRENSGLTFPHKLHLDPMGGPARMAASIGAERGYGAKGMQCKNCHRPSEDGIRFKPVNMERDCEGCHSLAYDKVGGTFRTLKHGDVDQMIADLRAADFSRTLVSGRRRPGDYAAGGSYYADFSARAMGEGLIRRAMSRDGVCGECHTPVTRGGKAGVMPVTLPTRYMAKGWFDHKPHRQAKCTTCHAAEVSSSSSDVLLPGIATCRTCHLGEGSSKAAVPSGCAMCHAYHPVTGAPRDAARNQS